ncbi:AMP-binding protein, partial [Clostridium sp. BL-8]|uniref:AMP-binding protein n=1 Tax=Clostridium sp. BL-8 TaxID=349938 RepID=UPI001178AFBF
PIDPEYPEDRIKYMLEDSNTKIFLTQNKLLGSINYDGEVIDLEDSKLYERENSNVNTKGMSNDLAYVIYTSGTTGKPKGVMIEQKALVNLCIWHNEYYEVTEKDNATKYAGFGFDASVWEIFPYIIAGATLHIIDKSIMLDKDALNKYYEDNKITIGFLPTQMCEEFMSLENKSLRKLLTGADKLKVYKKQTYELINNYGPTENAVVT